MLFKDKPSHAEINPRSLAKRAKPAYGCYLTDGILLLLPEISDYL